MTAFRGSRKDVTYYGGLVSFGGLQNFGGLQALPGSQRSQKPRLQHYLRRNVWRVAMNEKCVRCAVAVSALSAAPLADPPSRREQYCEYMGHLAIHLRPGPPTGPNHNPVLYCFCNTFEARAPHGTQLAKCKSSPSPHCAQDSRGDSVLHQKAHDS